ncbi:HNH endonuclease [bacterium]|nr:HNH endonuclease [bacterium]
MSANLKLFKTKMKKYKTTSRTSTISHAFASALAISDPYDESALAESLKILGQSTKEPLRCVFCTSPARTIDHLNGLVEKSRFTGHGHVIGNLVPCCEPCNTSKGSKPWRTFAKAVGTPDEQIERIAAYEALAPTPMSEDDLRALYPDLMEAYARMRSLCHEMLRTTDNLAAEIQRLERKRLNRNSLKDD